MDIRNASPGVISARLQVHAEYVECASAFELALHRLRARYASPAGRAATAPLALRLCDLQGRCLADIREAGPLTVFDLPPGTFVLSAACGLVRRGYTLTLEADAGLELRLHIGPGAAAMSMERMPLVSSRMTRNAPRETT